VDVGLHAKWMHLAQNCPLVRFGISGVEPSGLGTRRLGNWKVNTLRTGDADLRFYITTVQHG
jgi:hypothetical protein